MRITIPGHSEIWRHGGMAAAIGAALFALYGWAKVFATGLGFDGKIGPYYNALGCDWAIFYTAAHGWFAGHLAQIYDQVWLKETLNTSLSYWLTSPMQIPAFHYPPTYLLVIVPFGGMAFAASYAAFMAATFAALLWAAGRYAADKARFCFLAGLTVLAPATAETVLAGQNIFLIAAFFLFGFALMDKRPFWAGVVLGLVSIKPQLMLMLPFALIGGRHGRALAGMLVSAAALAALSAGVFGPGVWEQWAALFLPPRTDVAHTGIDWGRMWDDSVFTIASLLGASKSAANICQAAVTAAAAACVWRVFSAPAAKEARLAVLLAAAAVASPHLSTYDLLLPTLAAILVLWRDLRQQTADRPLLSLLLFLTVWILPLTSQPKVTFVGMLTPVALFAFIGAAMRPAKPAPCAEGAKPL